MRRSIGKTYKKNHYIEFLFILFLCNSFFSYIVENFDLSNIFYINLKKCNALDSQSNIIIDNDVEVFDRKDLTDLSLSVTENEILELINITNYSGSFDGYNLFILGSQPVTQGGLIKALLIVDMQGNIIAKRDIVFRMNVKLINSTTILYPDSDHMVLWNFRTNSIETLDFVGHHELEYNPINNTFFILESEKLMFNNSPYLFDTIYEYNRAGQIVWSLNTSSFINYTQWCPYHDLTIFYGETIADITHTNTVFFDVEEDIIYFNVRNLNTFYKINHSTKEIIWSLGEYGNFTLFDQDGNEKQNLFYHAHAVERVDDNTFILFDNDYHNQTNPTNNRSRILEIIVNETTMTAYETWSWTGSSEYYSEIYGDADRLPNNNRLGTFGTRQHGINVGIGARIVEVSDAGQVVWEMNFPYKNNYTCEVYAVERFRLAPILSSPKDITLSVDKNISINWNAWYNFRSKQKINGSFALYLNGVPIQSGIHTFDKYWRSTNLTFNLNLNNLDILRNLKAGSNYLTLELSDEAGHKSYDTVYITILIKSLRTIGYPLFIFVDFLLIVGLLSTFTLKNFKKRSKTIN